MSTVLVLSSFVSFGHVGASAAAPALQALGHAVTALPTILLSNHPGWPHAAGQPIPVETLEKMVAALDQNGFLAGHDTVLTGYLPSAAHVDFAAQLIARMRALRPDLRVVVDPVMGDSDKGLYIAEEPAQWIRDRLAPLADLLTPNAFELGWLTGRPVTTLDETLSAARQLGPKVCVTSPPMPADQTGVLEVAPHSVRLYRTRLLTDVPKGVGDVFAGCLAGGLEVGQALGHLQALIASSRGAAHLRIAEAAETWRAAAPITATDPEGADGL